jgi:hypothetical protein
MDFTNATYKIADISLKVTGFIDKLNVIKDKYVKKINRYLADLENVINSIATRAMQWVETQVEKIMKKIQDLIDGLMSKINELIKQFEEWYEKQMLNIKICVVKSVASKLGQHLDTDQAKSVSSVIPHPPLQVPSIEIELEIPDLSDLANIGQVSIPRLEI